MGALEVLAAALALTAHLGAVVQGAVGQGCRLRYWIHSAISVVRAVRVAAPACASVLEALLAPGAAELRGRRLGCKRVQEALAASPLALQPASCR